MSPEPPDWFLILCLTTAIWGFSQLWAREERLAKRPNGPAVSLWFHWPAWLVWRTEGAINLWITEKTGKLVRSNLSACGSLPMSPGDYILHAEGPAGRTDQPFTVPQYDEQE
jgi:hypothetical protein